MRTITLAILALSFFSCTKTTSEEQLLRVPYTSEIANEERDFFLYLPKGYDANPDKEWPVLLFLHGNGERGNGKDELGFTMIHGPLNEAWIQKRDLPFIIISPQLHMFTMGEVSYIKNRSKESIPQRLAEGTPKPNQAARPGQPMNPLPAMRFDSITSTVLPDGWDRVEHDLIGMLDHVQENYRTDNNRIYLSGLSYGGFGTWYLASNYPERFAAIAPIVGWGHPDLMPSIAQEQLPVWCFAGGRDLTIKPEYFYAGLNELEALGHKDVRFTIHADMGHDTWKRVYAGEDIYNWLLSHSNP
ncbi:carboxylesterase family protein [Zhouia amylolytica]|uniref:Peptidase-like protein n=1 Tax=Zhouia amylolytica AD3 TaxID=1286632 RepID=W2UII6_9FLAO|nr:alpha/beta hydrolase-fold protein [Zhouia amylolytica]ETN93990.1 peptidase-like protein [Zhouia amylolytica AD3]